MNRVGKKLALAGLVSSLIVAFVGLTAFVTQTKPRAFKPVEGENAYLFPMPHRVTSPGREPIVYPDPFSDPVLIPDAPSISPDSQLALVGTLTGENPRAILAEKTDPMATHIVGLGETLAGEKLITIGKGYVILLIHDRKVRLQAVP